MPSVSIIIPTYKHARYVGEALESVFAQTFTDYEVIVVNDGSPDDTAAVLRSYLDAGRIKYIEQPNAGQAAARNRGMASASGEFIVFLDDDDMLSMDALWWHLEEFRRNPHLKGVAGTAQIVGQATRNVARLPSPKDFGAYSMFMGCPFISPGMLMFRTGDIRELGGFDRRLSGADDYDLYFRLTASGIIRQTPHLTLLYRRHTLNASSNIDLMVSRISACIRKQLRDVPLVRRPIFARQAFRWLNWYMNTSAREMAGSTNITSREQIKLICHLLHSGAPYTFLDIKLLLRSATHALFPKAFG